VGARPGPGRQHDQLLDDRRGGRCAWALPVRLAVANGRNLFLPAGALGQGAIYTEHGAAIQILRKVILRVGAKLDYLILKLH